MKEQLSSLKSQMESKDENLKQLEAKCSALQEEQKSQTEELKKYSDTNEDLKHQLENMQAKSNATT